MNDSETADKLSDYATKSLICAKRCGRCRHRSNLRKCRTMLSRRLRGAFNCRRFSAASGILSWSTTWAVLAPIVRFGPMASMASTTISRIARATKVRRRPQLALPDGEPRRDYFCRGHRL